MKKLMKQQYTNSIPISNNYNRCQQNINHSFEGILTELGGNCYAPTEGLSWLFNAWA